MDSINAGLAFMAGVASFVSPCTLPLIPAFIGYLGGISDTQNTPSRLKILLHGVAFVSGFTIVFMSMGAAFSAIGWILSPLKDLIARIGGIAIILFGLHSAEIIQIPFLNYDIRYHQSSNRPVALSTSFLMGVFFSAGWSPCAGTILGAILTLAMQTSSISNGFFLLGIYALGMGIPFLILASGIGQLFVVLKKNSIILHNIQVVSGWLMIGMGILLFAGLLSRIASWLGNFPGA